MLALTGLSVTSGVAVGRVHRLLPHELEINRYQLKNEQVEAEVQRFHQAVSRTSHHLDQLISSLESSASAAREFLDTHRLLLSDQELIGASIARIRQEQCNAEWALARQRDAIAATFAQVEDAYLRARIEDVEHVVNMILQSLQQASPDFTDLLPSQLTGMVVVTQQISPAEVAVLHDRGATGLILERGSSYAHSAILARGLNLPTLTGVSRALSLLAENEEVILDGHHGVVFVMYEDSLRKHYRTKQAERAHQQEILSQQLSQTCQTRDGQRIALYINAERPEDVSQAILQGAEGVGLMRTEHLFLGQELLDEQTQYHAYRAMVEAAEGRPVTIRTLDAGGDKPLPALGQRQLSENPALGLRAIRLCLHHTELFRTQLRAILRAAAAGPVRLLLPMITQLSEIRLVRRLLAQCQQELQSEGLVFKADIPLGAMIEVPAAAMAIHYLLPELDFIAIGSNDLAQYALAADRLDPEVGYLHDPLHPGLLRMIQHTLEVAQAQNKPASLCGEIAGDPRYTQVLLGLGLREFSMHSASLPEVKLEVLRSDASISRRLMQQHLRQPSLEGTQLLHHLSSEQAESQTGSHN